MSDTKTATRPTRSRITDTARAAAPAAQAASTPAPAQSEAEPTSNVFAIEINKTPFVVGGASLTRLQVRPLSLKQAVACFAAASRAGADEDARRKALLRFEMVEQVTGIGATGAVVKLDLPSLLELPACYASALKSAMDLSIGSAPVGEVLSDADGFASPVLYRFGTPIATGSDGKSIEEIEIQARNLGDLEDFLSATGGPLAQALALIKTCATPVATDTTLLRLPSWAIDQISLADGVEIAQRIVPRFL